MTDAKLLSCWFNRSALVLTFALPLTGLAANAAQASSPAKGVTCSAVPAAGGFTSNPISCTVNCRAGGTIASAVALKPRTSNLLTITIKGTCAEAVDDLPSGITLQAGSSGATLQAPNSSSDPVLGVSGTGVTLDGLTISGGAVALRGHPGAAFTGHNLLVENASTADVYLDHAAASLDKPTIENSAGDGIDVFWSSTLHLNGGVVQKNAGQGVSAVHDGNAEVLGGAMLQKNGLAGAGAEHGGNVSIFAGTVTGNGSGSGGLAGINVGTGGHLEVSGGSTVISGNNLFGISVYDGGSALINSGVIIEGNSGVGLYLSQGAFAKVRAIVRRNGAAGIYLDSGTVTVGDSVGPATIENNKGNGLFMRTNSVAIFQNAGTKITNNAGWGILCIPSNPLILNYLAPTVSGNTAGQVSCKISP